VSDRVRTDFNNGNEYRRLHGSRLIDPVPPHKRPSEVNLQWHRENRYLG
jgi:putative restriction endonuclease